MAEVIRRGRLDDYAPELTSQVLPHGEPTPDECEPCQPVDKKAPPLTQAAQYLACIVASKCRINRILAKMPAALSMELE